MIRAPRPALVIVHLPSQLGTAFIHFQRVGVSPSKLTWVPLTKVPFGYQEQAPNSADVQTRRRIIATVTNVIQRRFGSKYTVQCFGSTVYGVDTARSDLDMVIMVGGLFIILPPPADPYDVTCRIPPDLSGSIPMLIQRTFQVCLSIFMSVDSTLTVKLRRYQQGSTTCCKSSSVSTAKCTNRLGWNLVLSPAR